MDSMSRQRTGGHNNDGELGGYRIYKEKGLWTTLCIFNSFIFFIIDILFNIYYYAHFSANSSIKVLHMLWINITLIYVLILRVTS
jgi:hypothetical protein